MRSWLRKWWPLLKALLVVAILAAIGRQFARDLSKPELWQRTLDPGWLALSGVLYLFGLGFSSIYWYRLLRDLDQRPPFLAAVRAHYIGQLGKYLPGKAWALIVRSNMIRGPHSRVGVAVLTSFYEVFMTMTAGALLAAILFGIQAWQTPSQPDWHLLRRIWETFRGADVEAAPVDPRALCLLGLLLCVAIAVPSIPLLFNRLVQRLALPFRQADADPLPAVRAVSPLEGLVLTPGCWFFMGASLWAVLRAANIAPDWSGDSWLRYTAYLALAYVSGFVILILPSGLGAREALLLVLLVPDISQRHGIGVEEARPLAALVVVLLRVVWTAAELVTVAAVYWLPASFLQGQPAAPPTDR
jgi:uncharacterized membrane protein YbhN (UPF0104 family)